MKKILLTAAALLATGLTLTPEEASAQHFGYRGGRPGFAYGGWGYRPGFYGGGYRPGFYGGYRPAYGYYRPYRYYRPGVGAGLVAGTALGLGLAAAATAPAYGYYGNPYGYGSGYGYGYGCYQVPRTVWNGFTYVRALVTVCN